MTSLRGSQQLMEVASEAGLAFPPGSRLRASTPMGVFDCTATVGELGKYGRKGWAAYIIFFDATQGPTRTLRVLSDARNRSPEAEPEMLDIALTAEVEL